MEKVRTRILIGMYLKKTKQKTDFTSYEGPVVFVYNFYLFGVWRSWESGI